MYRRALSCASLLVVEVLIGLVAGHVIGSRDTDWSVSIIESTMARLSPDEIDGWGYQTGLYLLGSYEVYKRVKDPRYLSYMQTWADRYVDDHGNLNYTLDSLDSMQSGNVLLVLHAETGEEKYRIAASHIRGRLDSYPRTTDGAFWHATDLDYQLWADGTFMVNPFLARYGTAYGEKDHTDDETAKQLILYGHHLQVDNGLLLHAYDESGTEDWASPSTGQSPEQWCRAIGWYGMALTNILDIQSLDHPLRPRLLLNLQNFLKGVLHYQDRKSGRWFQVVNKGFLDDNWTETSCSAMFTNTLSTALQRRYVRDGHGRYRQALERGYRGVLDRIRKDDQGLTDIYEICIGTNVGANVTWYLDRPRKTNDLHGLGSVLLMNEQVLHHSS